MKPKPTGTVRLVDKRTRVVEVFGPLPPGGRRPKLLIYEGYAAMRPTEFGALCIGAKDRVAKFLIDPGITGDRFLEMLDKHPQAKARPVTSYGLDGWTLEMPDGNWRGPPLRPKRTR